MAKKRKRSRQRQLDMAVATIHRRFGARSLLKGRPASTNAGSPPHISTGFRALDRALGIGGLPRGRMCELVGPATSGKTTLALKFLAQAQAGGGQVAYVDQALYFDPDYAHRCGLDLSRLLVGTSHDLREALATIEALVRSGGEEISTPKATTIRNYAPSSVSSASSSSASARVSWQTGVSRPPRLQPTGRASSTRRTTAGS